MEDAGRTTFIDHEIILTDTELLECGQKVAELDQQQDDLLLAQKAASAEFKAKLNANETERKTLSKLIRDKKKTVNTECYVEFDFTNRLVIYRSVESVKIVRQRTMTDLEYSLPSFGSTEKPFGGDM